MRRVLFTAGILSFILCAPLPAAEISSGFIREETKEEDPAFRDRLDFANGLYTRDMFDMAAAEYKQLIKDFSGHSGLEDVYFRLAECLFFSGKGPEALNYYQRMVTDFSASRHLPLARLRMAELWYRGGDRDKAAELFNSLIQSDNPQIRGRANFALGEIYFSAEKWAEAESAFTAASLRKEKNPLLDSAGYYLGEIALQKGELEKAAAFFRSASEVAPMELKQLMISGLGKAAFKQKQYAQAAEYFQQAFAMKTDPAVSENAFLNYMNALYAAKEYDRFIQDYEADKDLIQDPKRKAAVENLAANVYLQKENFSKAGETYDRVLSSGEIKVEQKEEAMLGKIDASIRQGKTVEAEASLEAAGLGAIEDRERWYFLQAEFYRKAKDYNKALQLAGEFLAQYPDSSYRDRMLLNQGHVYAKTSQWDAAIQSFNAFLKEFPEHQLAEKVFLNKIRVYVKTQNWDKAIENSRAFLEKYPASEEREKIHFRIGSLYMQKEDYAAALEAYQEHLEQYNTEEKDNEIYFFLGLAAQSAGQLEDAVTHYQKTQPEKTEKALYYSAQKNLAYCLVQLDRLDAAAAVYQDILEQYPKNDLSIETLFWLAGYYREKKDSKKIRDVVSVLRGKPEAERHIDDIQYFLGEANYLSGDFSAAIQHYDKTIAKGGKWKLRALFSKGLSLVGMGELDQGIRIFEETLQNSQSDIEMALQTRIAMAQTYYKLQDFYKSAKAYFAVGILYDNEQVPGALLKAGEAFEQAQLKGEARKAYEELLQRYPKNILVEDAKTKLEKLAG